MFCFYIDIRPLFCTEMYIHTFYLMIFWENKVSFFKGKHEEEYTNGNTNCLKLPIVSFLNLKTVMFLNMRTIILPKFAI